MKLIPPFLAAAFQVSLIKGICRRQGLYRGPVLPIHHRRRRTNPWTFCAMPARCPGTPIQCSKDISTPCLKQRRADAIRSVARGPRRNRHGIAHVGTQLMMDPLRFGQQFLARFGGKGILPLDRAEKMAGVATHRRQQVFHALE
jgi:hypothetical protein